MKWLVYLLSGLLISSVSAQQSDKFLAAPWLFSGGLCPKAGLLSSYSNPAAVASIDERSLAVFTERKLLLKELDSYLILAGIPLKRSGVSFQCQLNGTGAFQELLLGLNYAKKLSEDFRLGATLFRYNQRVEGYPSRQSWGYAVGFIMQLDEDWTAGLTLQNLFLQQPSPWEAYRLPPIVRFGLAFQISESLLWDLNIAKGIDQPINLVSSFHYQLTNAVFGRLGFQTSNGSLVTGASFRFGQCRLDLLTTVDPGLGVSPGLALIVKLIRDVK